MSRLELLIRAIFNYGFEPGLSGCDYYRGVGACSTGASCAHIGEPCCMTDRPVDGWPNERNLVGRLRYVWKGE